MPLDEITSPSLSPHCMRCLLDKFLDACPTEAPWEERADYLRRILHTVAEGSTNMTAPEINHELGGVLRDMFGIERDYTDVKRHFNQLVLGLEDRIARRIEYACPFMVVSVAVLRLTTTTIGVGLKEALTVVLNND